jgi:phosphoglycolate phosphatase-like HAD superfamily hydrolase
MTGGRPTVIVDVDGTLADVSGIRHYVLDDPRRKNFEKFHAASSYVTPMPLVAELVRALAGLGFDIVILTSRKERWRHRTRAWLGKWDIPFDALGMRSDDDERRDDDVKRDLYAAMRRRGYEPVLALDDNPTVVALWQALSIPTVVVPGWDTP